MGRSLSRTIKVSESLTRKACAVACKGEGVWGSHKLGQIRVLGSLTMDGGLGRLKIGQLGFRGRSQGKRFREFTITTHFRFHGRSQQKEVRGGHEVGQLEF